MCVCVNVCVAFLHTSFCNMDQGTATSSLLQACTGTKHGLCVKPYQLQDIMEDLSTNEEKLLGSLVREKYGLELT